MKILLEEIESCEASQTNTRNENQVVDTTITESVEEILAASEAESNNTSSRQLLQQQEVIVSNHPNISCFVCETQNSSIEYYKCVGCGNKNMVFAIAFFIANVHFFISLFFLHGVLSKDVTLHTLTKASKLFYRITKCVS